MTFVEFDLDDGLPGEKDHFAGPDLQTILDETNGGKSFAGAAYSGYREVEENYLRELGVQGIENARKSGKSFFLRTPYKEPAA